MLFLKFSWTKKPAGIRLVQSILQSHIYVIAPDRVRTSVWNLFIPFPFQKSGYTPLWLLTGISCLGIVVLNFRGVIYLLVLGNCFWQMAKFQTAGTVYAQYRTPPRKCSRVPKMSSAYFIPCRPKQKKDAFPEVATLLNYFSKHFHP